MLLSSIVSINNIFETLLLKKLEKLDKSFLNEIYTESEFIDPVNVILERCKVVLNDRNISTPFIVTELNETLSFFTIESSNNNVTGKESEPNIYWLESFFITKKYQGKGYSRHIILKMLQELPTHFPALSFLKLTVNINNIVAQNVYKKCGFIDTLQIYSGGPAGPQHIYCYKI